MISVTNLRAGTTFQLSGRPYLVLKYTHTKLGRGRANVKVKVRNLLTGAIVEKTFMSDDSVEEIQTVKKKLQFLYADSQQAVFMDPDNFEQVTLGVKVLGNKIKFLKEGGLIDVLLWGGKPLSVQLPPKVDLAVQQAAPGVRGNSASNMYKDAVLENNLKVRVPLFVKPGDIVRIDTRSGEYVERVA